MQIKCLVIDDEPLARRLIESHIEKLPLFSQVKYCNNAIEGLQALRKETFDLLLLDVQMPELNGIELLKSLSNPPKVILITAFRDFAIEAFDLNVIDYLVKPVSFERFVKSINKFLERSATMPFTQPEGEEVLLVRSDRKMQRINISDIIFIESLKDYVKINTKDRVIITKETISSLEDRLLPYSFLRIHRSYLISIPKVEAFNHELVEINGKQLPYGRSHKDYALERLSSNL
jgi:two-component system, LytTR family, response regulator